MKRFYLGIFIFFILNSFHIDSSGPWVTAESKLIQLYTRPNDFSKTDSPDQSVINHILQEQEEVIFFINKKLKTSFNSKVKIYLFNYDEAKEKIGTNQGGGANSKKGHIYLTFHNQAFFNTITNKFEYVGIHEMVHIITFKEFGRAKSKFFSEGYANAIDGNYGVLDDMKTRRRIDSTIQNIKTHGGLLTPTELLYNDNISHKTFYPQIGYLFNWMFETYGVENINKLFTVNRIRVEKNFLEVTGDTFKEMENKYMEYILNQ